MATSNPQLDVTIRNKWEATIAADRDPDQTIPTGAHATQRGMTGSLAEELCRVGYAFGDELGRGGLGVVNLATQQVFARPVAVKRLLRGGADRETVLKFFAEAVITAQLEHPHIVPIHDLMADGDGQLRLVMKRVEGQSWRDLLHPRSDEHRQRAQAMSLDDHLDILLKVCEAMSFAHGRGILHRDGSRDEAVTRSIPTLLRVLIITLIRLVPIHAGHHAHRTSGHQFPQMPTIIRHAECTVNSMASARRPSRGGHEKTIPLAFSPSLCWSWVIPA